MKKDAHNEQIEFKEIFLNKEEKKVELRNILASQNDKER